ncbi:hypothetical protein DEJ33_09455 [Curtobacterium sp. MCPF17_047]|nr:hypothetical protein DEJ24_00035 [Curtobacterium sp. MCPF17_001]PZF65498.1 hypothetical protein DEJ33_09455 [Curtobacterium sp. MCPF17_047]
MRGFVNAMVIALRARPEFLNGPTVFVVLIGSPTLLAALYLAVASASGTSSIEPPDAVAAGLAVAGVMSTMSSSSLLSADQVHATLPFIVIAPASRALVWTARVFVVTSIGVVQGIVSVVASFAVTRNAPSIAQALPVFGLIVLAAVVSVGLGLSIAALGLVLRDSMLVPNIAEQGLTVLCGAVAPVATLWSPLQSIAQVLPVTHVVAAGRATATGGPPLLLESSFSVIAGIAWGVVGVAIWLVLERHARRTGAIESMSIG